MMNGMRCLLMIALLLAASAVRIPKERHDDKKQVSLRYTPTSHMRFTEAELKIFAEADMEIPNCFDGRCGFFDGNCIKGCVENGIQDAINQVNDLKNQIHDKIMEVANIKETIQAIKDIFNKMGTCLKTLPGSLEPMDAINALKDPLQEGRLPDYLMEQYVSPLMERAQDNVRLSINILAADFSAAKQGLVKDGALDIAWLADNLPSQVVGTMTKLSEVDPTVKCLMEGSLLDNLESSPLIPLLGDLIKTVLTKIQDMWNRLTGVAPDIIKHQMENVADKYISNGTALPAGSAEAVPKAAALRFRESGVIDDVKGAYGDAVDFDASSFLAKIVKKVTDVLENGIGKYMPALGKFDNAISNALGNMCQEKGSELLGFLASADDMPISFCSPEEPSMAALFEEGINTLITETLTMLAKEFMDVLNKYVWTPLTNFLVTIVGSAQSSTLQVVDGLAGLIPEAGGPIAMVVTVPLSALAGQLISELTSFSVTGLIKTAEDWVLKQIPILSRSASKAIVQGIVAGVKGAGSVTSSVTGAFDAGMSSVMGVIKPALDLLKPFIEETLTHAFPKIIDRLEQCEKTYKQLKTVVKGKLCPETKGDGDMLPLLLKQKEHAKISEDQEERLKAQKQAIDETNSEVTTIKEDVEELKGMIKDAKLKEAKPTEAASAEVKPEEAASAEVKPEEAASAEVKPEKAASAEVKPEESKSAETTSKNEKEEEDASPEANEKSFESHSSFDGRAK